MGRKPSDCCKVNVSLTNYQYQVIGVVALGRQLSVSDYVKDFCLDVVKQWEKRSEPPTPSLPGFEESESAKPEA